MSAELKPSRREQLRSEIVLGADDFLFHRFEMAFEQLCSDSVPTDRQLARWVSLFEQRFAWCASKGAAYVTLIVPERHVVYEDKLPPGSPISASRPVKRLLAAIDPAMRSAVLYPDDHLRAARDEQDVFLKTDEHVNSLGAYVCYRALLEHIAPGLSLDPLKRKDLIRTRRRICGNLGMRLDEEPIEMADTLHVAGHGGATRIFHNTPGHARVELFQHQVASLPKAVVFGDSNVFSLWNLLVPHFSRTVIVHDSQRLFHDLVLSERPDLVLNVMSETRLGNLGVDDTVVLPIDADIVDFLGHCGELLPREADRAVLAIDFAAGGNSAEATRAGWSYAEAGHTWMIDGYSILELPEAARRSLAASGRRAHVLELDLWPLTGLSERPQRLTVSIGAGPSWTELGAATITTEMKLRMPLHGAGVPADQPVFVLFAHPDGVSPSADGAADTRILSFAVRRLWIREQ